MKKTLILMLAAIIILVLASCGGGGTPSNNANNNTANNAVAPETDPHYGTYITTGLKSIDGKYSDETMARTLESMTKDNKLFYLVIGDKSYIYNPDGNGGYLQVEIDMDFDNLVMKVKNSTTDPGTPFKYENGAIIIDENRNQLRFFLTKGEAPKPTEDKTNTVR